MPCRCRHMPCRRLHCNNDCLEKMHLDCKVPVWPDKTPMTPPAPSITSGGVVMPRSDGTATVFVKVTEFPVPESSDWAGESMFVMLKPVPLPTSLDSREEDRWFQSLCHEGKGLLVNFPVECQAVQYGDLVRFGGGTANTKAMFMGKVNE